MLQQKTASRQVPVFTSVRKNGQYLINKETLLTELPEGNVYIPLNIDTEFWSLWRKWLSGEVANPRFAKHLKALHDAPSGRLGITTQIKGIATNAPSTIYAHDEVANLIPRHSRAGFDFHPVAYLETLGYDVCLRRADRMPKGLPVCQFLLYAHFALAELMMIAKGDYRKDFDALARVTSERSPRFEMSRRLRAVTPGKRGDSDDVKLPWILTIDGMEYQVSVAWVDTGAIHGIAGYKDVCEAAGIKLDDKDNFTNEEKGRMLEMAIDRPDDYDPYSTGDLYPYDIVEQNAKQFANIYKALGLEPKEPKLTIGATVKELFLSALQAHLGADEETFNMVESQLLEPVSAGKLRLKVDRTAALLAKVVGGRCRNNRPTNTRIEAVLCDLDISGCYGEGQRNQLYMVGKPEVIDYDATSSVNDYMTLRTFLDGSKDYPGLRDELGAEGTWFAIVSSLEPLKYPQDFLASWFVNGHAGADIMAKYVAKMASDTEKADVEFNEEDGSLKILNFEVHNAVITHDFIQWLDNVCSPQQRKELMDKLVIKSAMYYPESKRCHSFEELLEVMKSHTGKNTYKRKGKGKKAYNIQEDGECHAWYGVNIGELMIDDLISNRKLYPKKTPLNTLFKLCINTLYGDMTSKFFTSANVVVGNNITARARALAWYMEKGLYGFQTVTDGCVFELNRVVYPKEGRRVTAVELVNLYRRVLNVRLAPISGHLKLGAIGQVERIDLKWIAYNSYEKKDGTVKPLTKYAPDLTLVSATGEVVYSPTFKPDKDQPTYQTIDTNPAMDWVNRAAMEHLQTLFPGVDVLNAPSTSLKPAKGEKGEAVKVYEDRIGQFEFEAKDFYDSGAFHGSANYCLVNPNGENLKFRAYETKKAHESVKYFRGGIMPTDRYGVKNNPAKDFIRQLLTDTSAVKRQEVFVKESILKLSDYKQRQLTWGEIGLVPGDTFHKSGLLREFSLSQFTFKSLEQYRGWVKAVDRRKEKYGQSLEAFYINPDGTLDYQRMIEEVDQMIVDDVTDPFKALDPHENVFRDKQPQHPALEALLKVKEHLRTPETALELDYN